MATVKDVLRIASGEVGYDRWADPQAGTKYGRWYAQKTGSAYFGKSGVPYCAMFVSWVLDQAGQSVPGFPSAYCPSIKTAGINAGIRINKYQAQPGDIVLYNWDGGLVDHVGIVEVNKGSYIQVIEGNTSSGASGSQGNGGKVARRTRSWNVVDTVLRPAYGSGTQAKPASTPAPAKATGALEVDGYWGKATVIRLQQYLGTYVDGVVSAQPLENKKYLPSCVAGGAWQFTKSYGGGSSMVIALQRRLGITADGWFGPNSVKALQKAMGTTVDGRLDEGSECVKEMQRRLNNNTFLKQATQVAKPVTKTQQAKAQKKTGLDVDGIVGPASIKELQTQLGTTVDGVISAQYTGNKKYVECAGDGWEWVRNATGSNCIKKLQQVIGAYADGVFGKSTAECLQKFLKSNGYNPGGIDGYAGKQTGKAWQNALNGQLFKKAVASVSAPKPATTTAPAPAPAQPTASSTLKGIDISSHDNFNGTSFKANTESAYKDSDFVIVKVSQGLSYVNPQCDPAYQRAKREGKLLGIYHYAGGNDAAQEARYFYDNAKGYFGEAIPVIDFESYQNKAWNDSNWVRRFVDKVHELSGVWCMIYVQASAISRVANCANNCSLWVAGYPDNRNNWRIPAFNYKTAPWETYTIWQYSSSGGQTDRDVAKLTKDAWKKIAKP